MANAGSRGSDGSPEAALARRAAAARLDGRSLSHATAAAIRRLAVTRVQRGERPSDVIRSYGFCRTSIYRWLRAYRDLGFGGIARRRHPGRAALVTRDARASLVRALVGRRPSDHGVSGDLWTRQTVADLIRRTTGVSISPMGVGRTLRRCDLGLPRAGAQEDGRTIHAHEGRGRILRLHAVAGGTHEHRHLWFLVDGRRRFLIAVGPEAPTEDRLRKVVAPLVAHVKRPVRIDVAAS